MIYDYEWTARAITAATTVLALISTEQLEQHVKDCQESLDGTTGSIEMTLFWREMDMSRVQLELVRHLLAARRVVDEYEKQFPRDIESACDELIPINLNNQYL